MVQFLTYTVSDKSTQNTFATLLHMQSMVCEVIPLHGVDHGEECGVGESTAQMRHHIVRRGDFRVLLDFVKPKRRLADDYVRVGQSGEEFFVKIQ